MNYLVTGGTGMIGNALIHMLNHQDNVISILTRTKHTVQESHIKNINFINKITQTDINNADIVINLAGEPIASKRWTKKQKNTICQSRWQITEHISNLIKQSKKSPIAVHFWQRYWYLW
jgi:hypothetical protein